MLKTLHMTAEQFREFIANCKNRGRDGHPCSFCGELLGDEVAFPELHPHCCKPFWADADRVEELMKRRERNRHCYELIMADVD